MGSYAVCVTSRTNSLDLEEDIDTETLAVLRVTQEHFREAQALCNPISLRETHAEVPSVPWASVGGLDGVKQDFVQFPVEHPPKLERFGMYPPQGVLFYGLLDCGKTLLADAIASECQAYFVSMKTAR